MRHSFAFSATESVLNKTLVNTSIHYTRQTPDGELYTTNSAGDVFRVYDENTSPNLDIIHTIEATASIKCDLVEKTIDVCIKTSTPCLSVSDTRYYFKMMLETEDSIIIPKQCGCRCITDWDLINEVMVYPSLNIFDVSDIDFFDIGISGLHYETEQDLVVGILVSGIKASPITPIWKQRYASVQNIAKKGLTEMDKIYREQKINFLQQLVDESKQKIVL